ncbi:sulfotransferase family 2 domain-containing protein [Nocardioides sp. YIM 152315]|uniref:sulfotransferase family 2 domain-containing protein n=1 Tax=Nocardioides sp. YIM 152315 TaxID=3031760 RepID=UPI0023DC5DBC|nr:sulfotransferase family 2 domain-containing protein [Nocardioides sp. YIM 152315]MDF1605568.1 sulfotransferase family 2 domain-containing protein [Nocardioides sp. YIM 152315]
MTSDVHGIVTRPAAKRFSLSVSDPGRFVYVRTAKVATRSISAAFDSRPDLEVVMHRGRLRRWPEGPQRQYTAFGFVRNPFARLVSCWQDKVVGEGRGTSRPTGVEGGTFEEFVTALETTDLLVTNRHVKPQTATLPLDRLAFLGRMERLQDDWERVCGLLGVGDIPLPRQNVSATPPEPVRIGPGLGERIVRLYALDFQVFGYDTAVPEKLR